MRKVLVTGAHGFIGRYVVEELLSRGYSVIAFDHHHDSLNRGWPEGVEVFLGDMCNDVQVTEAMAHADGWIHLAAVLGTQETILNPRPAALSNVSGGLNMLEAASQYDLPGVYICVGNHWMNNTYSISKTTVERFCKMYAKDRGLDVSCVRAVNAYGPRQVACAPFGPGKVRKIVPAFACRVLSDQPIEVYGDGYQVSDMVWVGDVAYTLVNTLEKTASSGYVETTIEVGPKISNTVNSVAKLINESAITLGYRGVDITHLPMRPGENPGDTVSADWKTLELVDVDVDKFVTASSGLFETVKWFHKNKGITWSYGE